MTRFSDIPHVNAEVEVEVRALAPKNPYDFDGDRTAEIGIAEMLERLRLRLGDKAMRTVTITVH